MGKYYNPITKEFTKYPYRFKTEDEFIKEYGSRNWRSYVIFNPHGEMDYLCGKTFESFDITDENIHVLYDDWYISINMLIKNDYAKPLYKPRSLIYE